MALLNKDGDIYTSARDDGTGKPITDIHLKSQEKPLQVDFPQTGLDAIKGIQVQSPSVTLNERDPGFSSFKTDKFTVTSTAQKLPQVSLTEHHLLFTHLQKAQFT